MNPNDPVDEFFDRERGRVTPLPATPEHWDAILAEHRAARRGRWLSYAAGAAAAVVIAAGVGYAVLGGHDDGTSVASQSSSAPAVTTPVTTASTSVAIATSTTSAPPTTQPVPSDFAVMSVSNIGQGRLFALGTTTSKGTGLPAVARSTDDGKSWVLVAALPGHSTPGRQSTGQVGNDSSLTEIRMANPDIGYLFGGLSMRTTDGGFHWEPYAVPGTSVLAIETDGKNVAIASSTGPCDGLTCTGDLLITQTSVTTDVVDAPTWTVKQTSPLRSVALSWLNGGLFLSVQTDAGRAAGPLTDKGFEPAITTACPQTPTASAIVVPASGGTILATCPGGGAAGSIGYGLASSADGVTWTVATSSDKGALLLANGPFFSVAASDAMHLVAASGGTADLHGSLRVSADGGLTWNEAAQPPPMPDRGWFWVGSPGGGQFYAMPAPATGSFWRSTDNGATWSKVQVARVK